MPRQNYNPDSPVFRTAEGTTIFEKFQYSAAVRAGDFVYVAGQIGLNPDGSLPRDGETQARNAFDRLRLVLEAAGSRLNDIVELVSYHVRIADNLGSFVTVKERYIEAPFPAWTILEVAGLARPGLLVEIKAVAYALATPAVRTA